MALSNQQIRYLRGLCHELKPVVTVAERGLADSVRAELDRALDHHELVKVKLRAGREQRECWMRDILEGTGAELVQKIGQVACLYRPNPEQRRISLPA